MIFTIFLLFITAVIKIIIGFFSFASTLFSFTVPLGFTNGINYFIGTLGYFNGIFPIDTLLLVISFIIGFLELYYFIKILIALWAIIPFIGRNFIFPTIRKKL